MYFVLNHSYSNKNVIWRSLILRELITVTFWLYETFENVWLYQYDKPNIFEDYLSDERADMKNYIFTFSPFLLEQKHFNIYQS